LSYNVSTQSLEEEKVFGKNVLTSEDFPSNSTNLRKIVYVIPQDRIPERLKLSYGFKEHKVTNVENWLDTELWLNV